jgi:hypothetical protein
MNVSAKLVLDLLLLVSLSGKHYMHIPSITSPDIEGNDSLFLILCPPSIGAMALNNAGIIGGTLGWLVISGANACLHYHRSGSWLCE